MDNTQITLYLVRHGETELNVQKIIQGHSDSELTENGKKQAEEFSNFLKDIQIDEFYSSDLKRAVHTAEIINKTKSVKVDKNLRERCYGRFEGKNFSELKILDELFDKVDKNSKLTYKAFPDVESDNEVALRMINFIKNLSTKNNKTVLAVTHAGSIRSLLLYLGWGTYDTLPPNAINHTSYVKLLIEDEKIKVSESSGIQTLPNI